MFSLCVYAGATVTAASASSGATTTSAPKPADKGGLFGITKAPTSPSIGGGLFGNVAAGLGQAAGGVVKGAVDVGSGVVGGVQTALGVATQTLNVVVEERICSSVGTAVRAG